MSKDFFRNSDFDLIRQFLPQLEKSSDELHRLLPHYRETCRKFRRILLYLLPTPFDPDPLAAPPNLQRSLLELRNKIETAEHIADALYQMEAFNAQTTATCGALAAWLGREEAGGKH